MALKKSIELPTGAAAEYHRITKVTFDLTGARVIVRVSKYLNKAARVAGKPAMSEEDRLFPLSAFQSDPSRADLYAALKASVDEYSGAVDA